MRNQNVRSHAHRVDYTKFSSRSSSAVDSVRGDVLRDQDCRHPIMTHDLAEKTDAYLCRQVARLAEKHD